MPVSDPIDEAVSNLEKSVRNLAWTAGFLAVGIVVQVIALVVRLSS